MNDLTKLADGVSRGLLVVDKWQKNSDVMTLHSEYLFELVPATGPYKPRKHSPEDYFLRLVTACGQGRATMLDMRVNVLTDFGMATKPAGVTVSRVVERYEVQFSAPDASLQQAAMNFITNHYPANPGALYKTPIEEKLKDLGLSIEPIVGYRDFLWKNGKLFSRGYDTPWPPREKLVAFCKNDPLLADHDAPEQGCKCGIYAFDTPNHHDLNWTSAIWAELYLWGEVLICDSGYRAEFAYPKTLFLRDTGTKAIRYVRDSIEAVYGVPAFLVKQREGLTASEIMEEQLRKFLKKRGGES